MKINFIGLIVCLVLTVSCGLQQENNVSETATSDAPPSAVTASLVSEGTFVTGTKSTAGTAKLYFDDDTDTYSVFLEGFSTGNGPDVHVYLSPTSTSTSGALDLGDIKSTNGNQRYDFPQSSFDAGRMHVIIWCRAFPQTFGFALLR